MAQETRPAEELCHFSHGFFFEVRTRNSSVQGMVVGIDPKREHIRQACDRVRWLQHLPGVIRVKIGIVVLHALRDLHHDGFNCLHVITLLEIRQTFEAVFQPGKRSFQYFEGFFFEHSGHFFAREVGFPAVWFSSNSSTKHNEDSRFI